MKTFTRTFIINQSIEKVFNLINDVDAYKNFIPFCEHSIIIESNQNTITAQLDLSFMSNTTRFITHNTFASNEYITMKLIKGPFKEFTAKWGFESVNESKTSLTFTMEYNISNPLVNLAFTKNLNLVSEKIIKAFKKELTEKVY